MYANRNLKSAYIFRCSSRASYETAATYVRPRGFVNVLECWRISRIYVSDFRAKIRYVRAFISDNYQSDCLNECAHIALISYCVVYPLCVCRTMKPERLWALIKYEKWLLRQILAIGRLTVALWTAHTHTQRDSGMRPGPNHLRVNAFKWNSSRICFMDV